MAMLEFKGVGITAMSAAVPHTVIHNYQYTEFFPEDQVKEVVDKIGILERRFADADTCSSDLCYAAAEKLLNDNDINRSEIDLLVFISQTPDYRMPATSILLQHRIGDVTASHGHAQRHFTILVEFWFEGVLNNQAQDKNTSH